MGDQGTDSKASGRLDCRYVTASGATELWSLIRFDLTSKYDSRKRIWKSEGKASNNRQEHNMKLTYDESRRILTIDLNGYLFTADGSQMMASNYNDRATLNIKFQKDVEGSNANGDHFTIKWNSYLDISL